MLWFMLRWSWPAFAAYHSPDCYIWSFATWLRLLTHIVIGDTVAHLLCDVFGPVVAKYSFLQENTGKLMFWGKISGETNDYLISYSLTPEFGFPKKKFFFCTTADFTLGQMPDLSDEFGKMASAITAPFRGEPSLPLMPDGSAGEPDEPVPEPAEGEEPVVPPERFREMHRLAYATYTIDHDVAILPKGAFIVDASHTVCKNLAYTGLSYEAAGNMANYYHFRTPESARAKAGLEKPGIVRAGDFMDPIVEDSPKGAWSLAYDTSSTIATLRSFYWPGYFFYHVVESAEYGGVYFGDGLPNVDLPFML